LCPDGHFCSTRAVPLGSPRYLIRAWWHTLKPVHTIGVGPDLPLQLLETHGGPRERIAGISGHPSGKRAPGLRRGLTGKHEHECDRTTRAMDVRKHGNLA